MLAPDIHKVVKSDIPQSRDSDAQRKGRCAQGLSQGFYSVVVPRWACATMYLKKTKGGVRSDSY